MAICRNGNHSLIEIARATVEPSIEMVTRWCSYCGGIVVDREYDNRVNPGYYRKMEFPQVTKNLVNYSAGIV